MKVSAIWQLVNFLILYAPMLFRTANIIFGTVLRSVGDTKTPMRVGVVMNILIPCSISCSFTRHVWQ